MTKKENNLTFSMLFAENPVIPKKETILSGCSVSESFDSQIPDIKAYLTKYDIINYAQNGVDIRAFKKMKDAAIFSEVDLHGLTKDEATNELNAAISSSKSRYLRVIHGKGKDISIIKSLSFEFAKMDTRVLAAVSIADSSGESGAMMFLLKL